MILRKWLAGAALMTGIASLLPSTNAVEPSRPAVKPTYGFSTLKALTPEAARAKVETWLKSVDKLDSAALDKIWKDDTRSILDRVADSLALGNSEAEALLANARKAETAAPTEVPGILKDAKQDSFFRTNIALAFAKALSGKKVYEEALAALSTVEPEKAVDPASFFFYKAVTEQALIKKESSILSISRLLDDVTDIPDRYRVVGTQMLFEMLGWSADPKDLLNIEKLMDNSARRLDLSRGGEQTQEIQKKILFRLDEVIKEAENKQKQGQGQCNGGNCPNGGQPGGQPGGNTVNPSAPAGDSVIMGGAGKGESIEKRLKNLQDNWGTLPPDKRAQAVVEITRDLPPKYKPMIEEYFKSLNRINGFPNNP
jgi:hypothetical protein